MQQQHTPQALALRHKQGKLQGTYQGPQYPKRFLPSTHTEREHTHHACASERSSGQARTQASTQARKQKEGRARERRATHWEARTAQAREQNSDKLSGFVTERTLPFGNIRTKSPIIGGSRGIGQAVRIRAKVQEASV